MKTIPIWLLLLLSPALARADDVAALLRDLRRPRTVVGELQQTRTARAFTTPQKARGRFWISRPDKLRWEYTAPFRAVFVLDGQRARIDYPDLKRSETLDLARHGGVRRILDAVLIFARADTHILRRDYALRLKRRGRVSHLELRPRGAARRLLRAIEIVVDHARHLVTELRLIEPDGDRTDLRFENLRTDLAVEARLFR